MGTKWKRYYCFHFAIIFKDNGSQLGGVFPFTKGPGMCTPPGPFRACLAGSCRCQVQTTGVEGGLCVCVIPRQGIPGGRRSLPRRPPFFFFFFFFGNIPPPWGLFLGGLLRILDSRLVRYPGLGGVVNVCCFFFFFFEKSTTWLSALGVRAFITNTNL